MDLFVTIMYGLKPYIIVFSQGVSLIVGRVLDLVSITREFCKILVI